MFSDDGNLVLNLWGWFHIRASSHLLSRVDVITRPTSNSSVKALNFWVVQADLGWLLADGLPGFIREHARSRKQAELFFPHCRGTAGGAGSKREAMGANAPGQASVDHTVALGMLSIKSPIQGPTLSGIWPIPGKGM